ncbi:hypothetical protein GCM10010191_55670 [Actinomadura vinacea]|uniref:Uncharacterized protein n=1 Tax=Actinomadura vinacea TaxID=115336 RepID=A0ABP5WW43_9ACTN
MIVGSDGSAASQARTVPSGSPCGVGTADGLLTGAGRGGAALLDSRWSGAAVATGGTRPGPLVGIGPVPARGMVAA